MCTRVRPGGLQQASCVSGRMLTRRAGAGVRIPLLWARRYGPMFPNSTYTDVVDLALLFGFGVRAMRVPRWGRGTGHRRRTALCGVDVGQPLHVGRRTQLQDPYQSGYFANHLTLEVLYVLCALEPSSSGLLTKLRSKLAVFGSGAGAAHLQADFASVYLAVGGATKGPDRDTAVRLRRVTPRPRAFGCNVTLSPCVAVGCMGRWVCCKAPCWTTVRRPKWNER